VLPGKILFDDLNARRLELDNPAARRADKVVVLNRCDRVEALRVSVVRPGIQVTVIHQAGAFQPGQRPIDGGGMQRCISPARGRADLVSRGVTAQFIQGS
jgi:hypothetical protein